jgi:F-type H+-transporting ATPase subunit b
MRSFRPILIAFTSHAFIWARPSDGGDRGIAEQKIARRRFGSADRSERAEAQAGRAGQRMLRAAAHQGERDHPAGGSAPAQIIDHAKEEAVEEGNRQKGRGAPRSSPPATRRAGVRKQVFRDRRRRRRKLLRREIDSNAHKAAADELAAEI